MESSANKIHFIPSTLAMPFMNTLNKRGPRTEPCGTPTVTGKTFDLTLFTRTYCSLFDKTVRELPKSVSYQLSSTSILTQSKGLLKSRNKQHSMTYNKMFCKHHLKDTLWLE